MEDMGDHCFKVTQVIFYNYRKATGNFLQLPQSGSMVGKD